MYFVLFYLFFNFGFYLAIFSLPVFYIYIFYIEIIFYITHLFDLIGHIIILVLATPGFFRFLKEENQRFLDINERYAKDDKYSFDKFLKNFTERVMIERPEAYDEYMGYLYSSYRSVRLIWHYKIFFSWKDYWIWILVSTFVQLLFGIIIGVMRLIVGTVIFLWYFLSYDKFVADVKLVNRRSDYYFNWYINFWFTHIFELIDDNILYTEWLYKRNWYYNMQLVNIYKCKLRLLFYYYCINPVKLSVRFLHDVTIIYYTQTKRYFKALKNGYIFYFSIMPSMFRKFLTYVHNYVVLRYVGYCQGQLRKEEGVSRLRRVYYKIFLKLFYYIYIKVLRITYLKVKAKLRSFNREYSLLKNILNFYMRCLQFYRNFKSLFYRDREYKIYRFFRQYRPYYDRFYQEKFKYTYDYTFKIKNVYFHIFFKWFAFIFSIWFSLFIINEKLVFIMVNDKFWHFYFPYISFTFVGLIFYFIYLRNKHLKFFLDNEICNIWDEDIFDYFQNSSYGFVAAAMVAKTEAHLFGRGAENEVEDMVTNIYYEIDDIDEWMDEHARDLAELKGYDLFSKADFKRFINKRLWVYEGPYEDYREKLEFLDTIERFNFLYWSYMHNQYSIRNLSPWTKLFVGLEPCPSTFFHRPEIFTAFAWLWLDFYTWMQIDRTYPKGDGWEHIDHFFITQLFYYIWIEILKFKHPELMYTPIWK